MKPAAWVLPALALITVCATFLLILMGALVTSNEAGDSVPDWPLAYGRLVPTAHLQGAAMYEYAHRVVAGSVGILALILAAWAFARERGTSIRILAVISVCALLLQIALGGLRVRLGESHSFGVATLHAFSAQVFLAIIVSVAVLVSPRWRSSAVRPFAALISRRLVLLCVLTACSLLLQALLGAGFRHRVIGAWPHVAGAAIVSLLVILSSSGVHRAARRARPPEVTLHLLILARIAQVLVATQLLLGPAAYVLLGAGGASKPAAVVVAVFHLGLGSALLADSVVLSLWAFRLQRT